MHNKLVTFDLPTTKDSGGVRKVNKQLRKQPRADTAVELRYRAILEQIPAIIYTDELGAPNKTLYINPRVKTITGYTPEEWLADDLLWFKIINKEDQERVWLENIRTEKTGEPYKVEYRIRTRDGQTQMGA